MKARCKLSCEYPERSLNTSPSSGRSPPDVWRVHVQEKLLPTVTTGWKLWIPAHAINFGFVPPSQRVLYVNIIAVSLFFARPFCPHMPIYSHLQWSSVQQTVCWRASIARLWEKLSQGCSSSNTDVIALSVASYSLGS